MKRYPRCILATRCVPWDEHGRLAEAIFRRGVRTTLEIGTRHLYIFGTAGEGYAVTEDQFDRVVDVFADEMRKANAEPMVGLISLSLAAVVERIKRCRDRGVRQFQISLPSWGALSDREMFAFFAAVCDPAPDCQFLHYNLPRAQRMLTGREYGKLSELHPNLVATKNTGDSMTLVQDLLREAPLLQHFLSERGFVHGCLFGECGILASLVMNWPMLHTLLEAGERRDVDTLAAIQRECGLALRTLFEIVPRGRIDGAYDKLFEKMHDPRFPLRLLPPYEGPSDDEFEQFVQRLGERLPHWIPQAANDTLEVTDQ